MDSLDHALFTIRFPWPLGTLAPGLGSLAWLTGNFPFFLLKEPPQGSIMCVCPSFLLILVCTGSCRFGTPRPALLGDSGVEFSV